MSAQLAAEPALRLAQRLRDFGVRKRAKIHEKTRERVVNFVWLRHIAHAKIGRRAARVLRNTHGVIEARG